MKLFTFLSIVLLSCASLIVAQEGVETPKQNAMSNVFGITLEGGITLGTTDYSSTIMDYTGKASLEYYLPSTGAGNFGFRIFGQQGFIAGEGIALSVQPTQKFKTKIDLYGGGVIYTISLGDAVYPWVAAGVSNLWFYPEDGNGSRLPNYEAKVYDKYMLAYNGDAGVRFLVSKNISVNVAGGIVVGTKDYLDDLRDGSSNDMFVSATAGVTYYFGRSADSDGDGVPNTDDACEDTPKGIAVDEFGCPLDADKDGVPDYLDKCPKTIAGASVDADGCQFDADSDGIADNIDKCANTPGGVKVDAKGCPLDSDGDGVADYLDKCSKTPAGARVNADGCALDADGDGISDSFDKCPNTPKDVQVNADGCPLEKDTLLIIKEGKMESIVLSGDTNFEFGKSRLLSNAYRALDGLVATMKEHPKYTWEIGGHTDAVGSSSYNKNLSRQRAQSVVDYLLNKGIERNMLKIVGYGEDNPIATNNTPEGKSMNRRVEIKLLSKGTK